MKLDHMITAIIIDDDEFNSELLKDTIEDTGLIRVIGVSNSQDEGEKLIREKRPDIVFLDVVMPNEDGFQFLERFEFIDFSLVFISSHSEYSLRAFKTSAIDFIMKPIKKEDLTLTISKMIKERNLNQGRKQHWDNVVDNDYLSSIGRLVIATSRGVKFVKKEDVVRLEADSNYCYIYLSNGEKIHSSKTLKFFYEQIQSQDFFFRVHKSHVINTNFLEEIIREDFGYYALVDKSKVLVAKSKYNELIERMTA